MFQPGNKFSVGNNGGRPRMYGSPEEMAVEIDAYFEWCNGKLKPGVQVNEEGQLVDEDGNAPDDPYSRRPKPYTVTGLALYLGFSDKSMLYEYQDRPEFSHLIKRARMQVEMGYESNLHGSTPTGSIFALKNMGWKDKVETEHSGNMGIVWQETKTYQKPGNDLEPKADAGA